MFTRTEPKETKQLKAELAKLPPGQYRDAYYAIADNIRPLAEALELADLDNGGDAGPLLTEHLKVCEMLDTFKTLELGKVV